MKARAPHGTAPVPPATAWGDYSRGVNESWKKLLADPKTGEPAVQRFLERHPCLVPFASGAAYRAGESDHGSIHYAVFRKPRLPGRDTLFPDFMRITRDSGALHVYLIEIEDPRKPMFRRNGQLRAEYAQAAAQLRDWAHWLGDPTNQLAFRSYYQIPAEWAHRPLDVNLVLVYGRRAEVEANARGGWQRAGETGIISMTFDRLRPDPSGDHDFTLTVRGGRLVALYAQPTFTLSSERASELLHLTGKAAAVNRCTEIPALRQVWLASEFRRLDAMLRTDGLHLLSFKESRPGAVDDPR